MPEVWVVTGSVATFSAVKACVGTWGRARRFESPLEVLGPCMDGPGPLLLVAELLNDSDTWVVALQHIVEQGCSPRRLLLAEPGVLEEVMQETFRQGQDHLLLWPADRADLLEAMHYMVGPPPDVSGAGLGMSI